MKKELRNILVPVDFKEPSIHALHYARNLAEKLNGDLLLLNVIETPGLLAEFFSSGDHLVKITDQAKDKLLELSKTISEPNSKVKIHTRVERGKPYREILEVARGMSARFVIMGENHQGTDAEQELGTTVYHVTLKSPVPVLTLKGEVKNMGDKIVVPLDLTKQTRKQLFSALAYGVNYGSKIYLVSSLIGGIKMDQSRILKKLKQAQKTLQENGVECHIQLFERSEVPPYKKVLDYAGEIDAGMILIMTHQEGYTYDNYIGAFAHHIINESKIPVLSLTASATNLHHNGVLKHLVDPMGLLKN